MAASGKRAAPKATEGSLAYDLHYADHVAGGYYSQPLVRPRQRVTARPKVRVRQAQHVSVTAVAGFAMAAAMAVVLLLSHVQLNEISGSVVELKSELNDLREQREQLTAEYEQVYDLKGIEETVTGNGTMSKPSEEQIIYLDLSEPDSAVVYERSSKLDTALDAVKDAVGGLVDLVEYFR